MGTPATAGIGINIWDVINNMNASNSKDPSNQHQQEHLQYEERQNSNDRALSEKPDAEETPANMDSSNCKDASI
jgi:hypothetical protein